MLKHLILFVLAFTGGNVVAQQIQEMTASSEIRSVTVFGDRATVTRSLNGSFPEGDISVRVPHLPQGVIDQSLRVSGSGSTGAKILGVRVEESVTEESSAERIKVLQGQIKDIEKKINALVDRSEVLKQKKTFVESLSVKTGEAISKNLPSERPSVADWAGMLKFVDSELDVINKENRANADEQAQLNSQKELLETKLGDYGTDPGSEKSAVIELQVDRPGIFNFEISYMIYGASWYPIYDIRSWSDTNAVEIVYMAQVNQHTGEDWNNVNLELSTAQPAVGANPPALAAWYLNLIQPVADQGKVNARGGRPGEISYMADGVKFNEIVVGSTTAQVPSQYAAANVSQQGVSTSFSIRNPQTIPSSGESKKVPIKTVSFVADPEYLTVPKFSPYVYTKAAVTNGADFPLLRGSANIFYNSDFVSAANIPLVLPNEKFDLYFGTDEGMKVKRELVRKFTDDSGMMSRKKRISYEYRISLQNFHQTSRKLTVMDQFPISQNEQIEVRLNDVAPGPSYQEGDQGNGYLRWVFNLKPMQKEDISYNYSVKFPPEINISGIE